MRKILSICLIGCLLFLMTGCNKTPDPIIPENIEVVNVLRIAYENVYLKDIVHIKASRTYSKNLTYAGYDPNEKKPTNSEDIMLCLDNRDIEIWRNNLTNEHIRIRMDSDDSGVYSKGIMYQLKQDCSFENENYAYKTFFQSWHRQQNEFVDLGTNCDAGYTDVFYWNWANLIAFECLFDAVEIKDDSTYILTSKPIIWEDTFYTNRPVVITLLINRADLTFNTIQLQCENWTEIADFEFYMNENDNVFYDQIPMEVWEAKPEGRALFVSPDDMPLEDGYVPFMYPYEYVKDICEEDNVDDLWTIVE